MPDFLTITPNPALDLATTTARVEPTHKLRCGSLQRYPGGGGINVARVLHRLGHAVQAWHLSGGLAGAQLAERLAAEGVPERCLPIAGETRENLSVVEQGTGQEYRFVMPGPHLATAEWQACLDTVAQQSSPARWIVASGSLPPGVPDDFYARLARIARQQGSRMVLDSSGPALAAALEEGVYLVKPSLREMRELTGLPLANAPQWQAAVQNLVHQHKAQVVALSVGAQGAVLATSGGVWQAPALPVQATTGTTGAGDCFLAVLLSALERGESAPTALRWGLAGGAAALLAPGTSLASALDVRRLLERQGQAPG
ncbi:MAG: 1-phosphofructokinase family hexose kinase [Giesbergeria sp.]|nr:1-phosphofructokinase family hexose kinase [Giesbergeria sp.]